MKKSSPWWLWNKMTSQECCPSGVVVTDYLLSECGILDSSDDSRSFYGPGEDIWKKFELLPTPPRSPSRPDEDEDEEDEDEDGDGCQPTLSLVSDLLDCESTLWGYCSSPTAPTGLKNDLLHDCMWSGQCTDACKRVHPQEQLVNSVQTPSDRTQTPCSVTTIKLEDGGSAPLNPSPALPVDPCTMLPYTPLSDHSYHNQQQMVSRFVEQPRTPPICDTPSDTEDDEIDVVTLPASAGLDRVIKAEPVDPVSSVSTSTPSRTWTSSSRRRGQPGRPPTVPPLRVVIPSSVLVKHKERRSAGRNKRFQKCHATSTSTSSSSSSQAASHGSWVRRHLKRRYNNLHHRQQRGIERDRSGSCSSDSEDYLEKRSMHNSMERKRRDDLRFAFQTLRQHVPELASNPKAPKVLILNRAASYARQLSQTGAALEKTLKQETRRRQELQRKLMLLTKLK